MAITITHGGLTAVDLRRDAGRSRDAAAARRMLAIALVWKVRPRQCRAPVRHGSADAARLGASLQCGRFGGLSDRGMAAVHGRDYRPSSRRKWPRRACRPDLEKDGVVRWRLVDLQGKIALAFKVHLHERSVGKSVRRLGFRRVSVRPRHPNADAAAQDAHKKTSRRWSAISSRPRPTASRSNSGGRTKPGSDSRAA